MASYLNPRWITFIALFFSLANDLPGAPVRLVDQSPVQITNPAPGVTLVDFGRVAFGNLELMPPTNAAGLITVRFSEDLADGRVNRHPPGSVRYAQITVALNGAGPLIVAPPADQRNTQQPQAVLTPPQFGVLLPFRWVEIEGWLGQLRTDQIRRRAAFASTWDDQASAFHSSDQMLNHIWDLCHYSIKATTFAGVYVDGDRERIAYEADAYINQLGQYYTDGDVQMARDTFARLLAHPTWPTEWADHMIFIAYADWMQTGDTNWLAANYPALKAKLAVVRERTDGLVVSTLQQMNHDDIVDWPRDERDGFVFTPVNTVVNAFHLRTLKLMTVMAQALHQDADAADFAARKQKGLAAFQEKLFDSKRDLYRDGEGTDHSSMHANLFPLAFDLVPAESRAHLAHWLAGRGMACSVYAAQYLLEGLFENDCASNAIALMTAPGDRSWRHMVDSGATITWEAWDARYKTNLDWTHAWGAAPANLLPRFVLGVQPLTPGWHRASIQPRLGSLDDADGKVSTPLGPVLIHCDKEGSSYKIALTLPLGMSAQVQLPKWINPDKIIVGGHSVLAHPEGFGWTLDQDVSGTVTIEAATQPEAPKKLRRSILKTGAVGDGKTLNTQAIQKAIDQTAAAGGGTVVIPPGRFLTGAVFLQPGVNLDLEKDSVLLGSTNIDDYPACPTRIEGHTQVWPVALVNADHCNGLQITGAGTVEGGGKPYWDAFWKRFNIDKTTKNLDVPRPRNLFIEHSHNVLLQGISLRGSGFWNLHLYDCQRATVDRLDIGTPPGAPSTDGIDVDSCQEVTIHGCYISVDDDDIALKGTKGPWADMDTNSPPVRHVRISDCTFGLGHAVLTLGSEACRVSDVVMENCRVDGWMKKNRTILLRLKLRPDTVQHYADIHVRNVTMNARGNLISIEPWTQYFDLKGQTPPKQVAENISVSEVSGTAEGFGRIVPPPNSRVHQVALENIDLKLNNAKITITNVDGLILKNVTINGVPVKADEFSN